MPLLTVTVQVPEGFDPDLSPQVALAAQDWVTENYPDPLGDTAVEELTEASELVRRTFLKAFDLPADDEVGEWLAYYDEGCDLPSQDWRWIARMHPGLAPHLDVLLLKLADSAAQLAECGHTHHNPETCPLMPCQAVTAGRRLAQALKGGE